MSNNEFIPQIPPMPQFRNYAKEIQDRLGHQDQALMELAGLNTEVVEILKGVQETQRLQGELLCQIADFLESLPPPSAAA